MKQFAVIGIGNFGYYLARRLYERGNEVMAVDIDSKAVQTIKDHVSHAVVADATDPEALKELALDEFDTVILSTGSILSNSILAALNLMELNLPDVHAKAMSHSHGKILKKIGVSHVFFPEKDMAQSMADRLHAPDMLDYLPFMEGYAIINLPCPKKFQGKSLIKLNLTNKYGVQVLAIIEADKQQHTPTGTFVVEAGHRLILLGPDKALDKLKRL
ncbi:MAG: TrkA family potassium uptake protein [Desulfobacterales bacterium]|nr:TrkA family potassium uptake protein [Desulfobacterales bacterium]